MSLNRSILNTNCRLDYLDIIMRLPEVFNIEKKDIDEKEWSEIKTVIEKAKEAYLLFRETEGKVLETDLTKRINAISKLLKSIEKLEPARIANVKKETDGFS